MSKYKYATIDIETTGLNRFSDQITYVGIGFCKSINSEEPDKYCIYDMMDYNQRQGCRKRLKYIVDNGIKCVWQNGKFDTLFLELHDGVSLPIDDDVMLMGTSYDLAAEHGLKPMAMRYLGVPNWDISKKDKTSHKLEVVTPYLKLDVKYTWQLYVYFRTHMNKLQIRNYKKLLKPAYLMYRDVERTGIYLDTKQMNAVKKEYEDRKEEQLEKLNSKHNINWNSPQQVAKALFEIDGLPVLKKSEKTGSPSADASTLNKLKFQGYEIAETLLQYKAYDTALKMFLNRWPEDSRYDGRLHPSFNLTNVVTGRTSCQNPNLQQVPRDKNVRSLFKAPKGKVFFEADYSQLELRIAADYSGDPTMIRIYNTGGDIHTETAKTMTGGREPTKEERSKAKAVNFGFLYGMQAKKFVTYAFDSYSTQFTLQEATAYRQAFFNKYTRLLPWHKEMAILCEMEGGVANRFGRFRALPKIYSRNSYERGEAERRAINTPVQGTGSDILISAAAEIHKKLSPEGLSIVGTVHDSIVGEFYEEDADWIVEEIRKIMVHPQLMDDFGIELKVPLEVDIGIGPWGSK